MKQLCQDRKVFHHLRN